MHKNDSWGSYHVIENDSIFFISFNESAADKFQKNSKHYNVCAQLKISLIDLEKLPTTSDMERMNIIEDNFEIFLEANDGLHVGRFTTNGCRVIYGYLPDSKTTEKLHLADSYFRDIKITFENDPDQKCYFDFLCPNEIEQQIVSDNHLLQAFIDRKDNLETPREIFHYLYFNNLDDRKIFENFAVNEGFKVTQTEPPNEDNQYLLVISHQDAPERISTTTTYLAEQAKIFNGYYDGWEAQIIECQ